MAGGEAAGPNRNLCHTQPEERHTAWTEWIFM